MSENVNIWNKLKSSSFCFTIDSMGEWNVSANKIAWLLLLWCLLRKMLTSHHIIDEGSRWWVRSEIILTANKMNGVEKSCVCDVVDFQWARSWKWKWFAELFMAMHCACAIEQFFYFYNNHISLYKGGSGENGGKIESLSKNKSVDCNISITMGRQREKEENYAKNSIVQRRKFPLLWVISLCKFFFLLRRTCLAFASSTTTVVVFRSIFYRTLSTRKMRKYLGKNGSSRLFYIEGGGRRILEDTRNPETTFLPSFVKSIQPCKKREKTLNDLSNSSD